MPARWAFGRSTSAQGCRRGCSRPSGRRPTPSIRWSSTAAPATSSASRSGCCSGSSPSRSPPPAKTWSICWTRWTGCRGRPEPTPAPRWRSGAGRPHPALRLAPQTSPAQAFPMSDALDTAEIKPAATILLLRDAPAFEVLMVKRHHQIDFASGALVFPGGKSHADDHDPAWAEHALGWADHDAGQRGLRIAAIREVFEEAGVLLAKRRDGAPMGEDACAMEVRQAVDAGRTHFLD